MKLFHMLFLCHFMESIHVEAYGAARKGRLSWYQYNSITSFSQAQLKRPAGRDMPHCRIELSPIPTYISCTLATLVHDAGDLSRCQFQAPLRTFLNRQSGKYALHTSQTSPIRLVWKNYFPILPHI